MIGHVNEYPISETAPISFILSKWMQHSGIRGGHKFEQFCLQSDWWKSMYRVELGNDIFIDVPLWKRPFDKHYLLNYERRPVTAVCNAINRSRQAFCLVDCGADIGLFTALVAAKTQSIKKAIGFEPNTDSWDNLRHNYKLLPFEALSLNQAVSDFNGNAVLEWPAFDRHDHAAFIRPAADGDISVTSIDSLNLKDMPGLLLKIDVEGQELNVIRGARETISSAKEVMLLFEAHPYQSERVAIDPCTILSELSAIRSCRFSITEAEDLSISLDRPFFSQVQHLKKRIFNILVHFD